MVEQTICPNCGQQMDVSNLFISGKAACPNCGYKGTPLGNLEYMKKAKKRIQDSKPETENPDPLDIRSLAGKLVIVWAGVLVMSLAMPEMRTFLPISVLGILLFGASYKFLEK